MRDSAHLNIEQLTYNGPLIFAITRKIKFRPRYGVVALIYNILR
jgi:hypothetical protein